METALLMIWVLMIGLVAATLWLGLRAALAPKMETHRAKKFLRAYVALKKSGVLDDTEAAEDTAAPCQTPQASSADDR